MLRILGVKYPPLCLALLVSTFNPLSYKGCWNGGRSYSTTRHNNLVWQGIWHGGGCSGWSRRGRWGMLRKPESKIILGSWRDGKEPHLSMEAGPTWKYNFKISSKLGHKCFILTESGGIPGIFCLWRGSSITCLLKSMRHIFQMRNTLLNVHISLSTRPPNGIGDKSAELRSTGRQLPPAGTRRFSWNEFWVSPVDLEYIRSRSLVLESCFKCRGEYQPLTWRFYARPYKEPGQTVQEFYSRQYLTGDTQVFLTE